MIFPILYFRVKGKSMEPAFKENDKVWINKMAYIVSKPKVGDVVVVKNPEKDILILKRIQKVHVDEYFVEGDNQEQSTDSRHWGTIKKKDILGKVINSRNK